MKTLGLVLFSCLFVLAPPIHAAGDLSDHVFFKHFIGKWSAQGELKGQDNNIVKLQEDWTGKGDGNSALILQGTRTLNGDTQPFTWTFTHNASTDAYEAVLVGSDPSQPLRFEAVVSEVDMTLELKALTGQSSSILVVEKFADDKFETLVSEVTFTDDQGRKTLEGTITHKKAKAP